MKVCLLAPELLPNHGGVGTYSVELAQALRADVDLTIVTLVRHKGNHTYSREQMEAYFHHRVRVLTISEARETFLYNAKFQWAVLRTMKELFREESFDLIHSQHAHMPDLLSGLVDHSAPTIRTVHTTIRGQRDAIRMAKHLGGGLEQSESWQIVLAPILRGSEWMTLHRPDHYVTVSDWMRRELIDAGLPANRVRVTYLGADPDRFRPEARVPGFLTPNAGTQVVLFPGRPTLVKGAAVMARAIPRILQARPNTDFVFTGGGSEDFLRLQEQSPEARAHIRFLGFVPYEQLPQVYASADVAVAPTFYENLPIRILESLASGVPVVASMVSGIPEAVIPGSTGLLVPPGSHEALATAVVSLLANEEERRRMGREARELASSKFTWARTATETLRLYREVTSGARGPGLRGLARNRSPRAAGAEREPVSFNAH
jgi:glycosyltransferase involved in cell wall biosynthesis